LKSKGRAVTPYSLVGETGENVPALKHFFRCTETAGTTITDIKGGVVWSPVSVNSNDSLVFNYNGSTGTVGVLGVETGPDKPVELISGAWHTFSGTKPILVVCAARKFLDPNNTETIVPASGSEKGFARVAIGDVNNINTVNGTVYAVPQGLGIAGSPLHVACGYNNTYATATFGGKKSVRLEPNNSYMTLTGDIAEPNPTVWTGSQAYLNSFSYKFDYEGFDPERVSPAPVVAKNDVEWIFARDTVGAVNQISVYQLDTHTRWLHGVLVAPSEDTLNIPFTPNPCMRIQNLALYGYAVFEFETSLPSDWEMASLWMTQEWKRGNRVIWPNWIGVA